MYYVDDKMQLCLEDFLLPFGGHLRKDNRWVKLAAIIPWDYIDEVYRKSMCLDNGRKAIPSRIAFGALYIKTNENLADERVPEAIQENPYMQYFLGLHEFQSEPLFDASMMVYFRKRFPVEELAKINEMMCLGKQPDGIRNVDRNDENKHDNPGAGGISGTDDSSSAVQPAKKNSGKLIMDATVAPADIKYPTDIDLLNQCREKLEEAVRLLWQKTAHNPSEHMLPYSTKNARRSFLGISKSKKWTAKKLRPAVKLQLESIRLAETRLLELKNKIGDWKQFIPGWLLSRLDVIPKIYEQQKSMFESNTHTCPDRICSLAQPHVRPIQRGKRPNPTEFGQKLHLSVVNGLTYLEQTSWSNFNEGKDLTSTVYDYLRKFGCYPEAVLADRIYQTRENRKFCAQHGIRLSGPPLGRVAAGTEDDVKEQMYKDSCERNRVEGRNGNSKRRWGLDLIYSKLDETSKSEAALNIIAMNAAAILARLLSLLFGFRVRLVFQ